MRDLPSHNRRFTARDNRRVRDSRGLVRSGETREAHTFGFYALGGFASVMGATNTISIQPGGYDARVGMVYEWRKGFFMVQTGIATSLRQVRNDVGLVRYTNTDLMAEDPQWELIVDSWGTTLASLSYTISNRQDYIMQLNGQIPILVGGHVRSFYAMGGFTFTFPFLQETRTSMNLSSRGSYERYYGLGEYNEWQEMDNHGYREQVPINHSNNHTDQRFDVLLSFETGYDWNAYKGLHLRFGAYADMGLLNFSTRSNQGAVIIPYDTKWDFATFQTTPIWFSNAVQNKYLQNFTVGSKLTILFDFPEKEKCVLCGLQNTTRRR